jgi:serine protease inhibitor ecotin
MCDKHMYVEPGVSTTHCPICNHHLNTHRLDKPIEDYFSITFDYSPFDMATMVVFREHGDKIEAVNSFIGDDALLTYKKLIGIKKE